MSAWASRWTFMCVNGHASEVGRSNTHLNRRCGTAHATVLIVDDDERTRQLLLDNLRDRCTVLLAANREQAADVLARTDVDVLLLDVGATDGPASLVCGRLIQLDDVARAVGNATAERTLDRELIGRHQTIGDRSGIIAESAGMRHVLTLIGRAAASDSPAEPILRRRTGDTKRLGSPVPSRSDQIPAYQE